MSGEEKLGKEASEKRFREDTVDKTLAQLDGLSQGLAGIISNIDPGYSNEEIHRDLCSTIIAAGASPILESQLGIDFEELGEEHKKASEKEFSKVAEVLLKEMTEIMLENPIIRGHNRRAARGRKINTIEDFARAEVDSETMLQVLDDIVKKSSIGIERQKIEVMEKFSKKEIGEKEMIAELAALFAHKEDPQQARPVMDWETRFISSCAGSFRRAGDFFRDARDRLRGARPAELVDEVDRELNEKYAGLDAVKACRTATESLLELASKLPKKEHAKRFEADISEVKSPVEKGSEKRSRSRTI
ncbi:MAG: hypothetical protein RLN62_06245 [Rickettsiales bacterium]